VAQRVIDAHGKRLVPLTEPSPTSKETGRTRGSPAASGGRPPSK
jgi:hypothetical protein